jgi:hypothetical protein
MQGNDCSGAEQSVVAMAARLAGCHYADRGEGKIFPSTRGEELRQDSCVLLGYVFVCLIISIRYMIFFASTLAGQGFGEECFDGLA